MRRFKSNYYSGLFPEMVLILLVPAAMFYPIYQLIRLFILVLLYPFIVLYFLLWKVLATVVAPIKLVEKKKNDYKEAKEILKLVCDHIDRLGFSGSHHPCYSRPILEAACQGAYEVVDEILSRFPKAIDCKNQNGLNIIQLAVINRSEKVYNLIYHIVERKDFYRTVMDSSKNNILHLAGRLAPSRILSRTTGAALQLQRELQWREELEKFVFPAYITEENIFKDTPEMVFTREHENLVKEGEKWMKTTAESCSITAALITTIVFAAAITVPGGSNQETGIPVFKGTVPFTIFAVSDAISLFASATALLVFLSILTARFSEQDFLVSLPRRLIIGLCTLFLSTTMMMIAFSATLFLVFVDQRNWMLGPIGGLTCLPIAVFVTLQFPLVVDLFRSTYFPIFGKQSYIERGKFNPNNIQYFFGNRGIEYVLE
ncbi:ankyrin repeat-containing protein ITN1-like [Cynara cardunculus var. scolymus]|uniref:ankyrin repeat-containing protein ITN1-like n=1 Tax=Cynara cardunculus var. scolymus TaxID=59895 RepID=UPI000D62FA2F|nr:ankyrin repeat-containing protein ITN1-like [Cynara cardunculus var. scolymus]